MSEERLLHAFAQVRSDNRMTEFTSYPNCTIVFIKDSGEMGMLGTQLEYNTYDDTEVHQCFTISKDSYNLKEYLERCEKASEHGDVYLIELWENNTAQDMNYNEELIMYFTMKPTIMFEKKGK